MTLLQLLSPTTLDHQVWLLETIVQLRAKDFDRVNWELLLEELESLSASERREVHNRLRILLMHLLKFQYQPECRSPSWVRTIVEQFSQGVRTRNRVESGFCNKVVRLKYL